MSRAAEAGRRAARRILDGIGLAELRELDGRLDALEEAVAESTRLAGPLQRHVAELEASLLPLLEASLEAEPPDQS